MAIEPPEDYDSEYWEAAVYWPNSGTYGLGTRRKTLEEAHADALQAVADGYSPVHVIYRRRVQTLVCVHRKGEQNSRESYP